MNDKGKIDVRYLPTGNSSSMTAPSDGTEESPTVSIPYLTTEEADEEYQPREAVNETLLQALDTAGITLIQYQKDLIIEAQKNGPIDKSVAQISSDGVEYIYVTISYRVAAGSAISCYYGEVDNVKVGFMILAEDNQGIRLNKEDGCPACFGYEQQPNGDYMHTFYIENFCDRDGNWENAEKTLKD